MHFHAIVGLASVLLTSTMVGASPLQPRAGYDPHSNTDPVTGRPLGSQGTVETIAKSPGCGARKAQLVAWGANAMAIAIATAENGDASKPMCGLYGSLDGARRYSEGDSKVGDSYNAGIYRNNWYMMRTSCAQFMGQPMESFRNADVLTHDDQAATVCMMETVAKFGENWYKVQRNGESGLQGAGAADVNNYRDHSLVIQNWYTAGNHLTDDLICSKSIGAI